MIVEMKVGCFEIHKNYLWEDNKTLQTWNYFNHENSNFLYPCSFLDVCLSADF